MKGEPKKEAKLRPSFPTSVKLDLDLREAAREAGLNLRDLLEEAIKQEIKKNKCPLCGHEEGKV